MEMETLSNQKINILSCVHNQKVTPPDYPDEAILASLYHISFPTPLKSIAKMQESGKGDIQKHLQDNEWLANESAHVHTILALNFDKIVAMLNNHTRSCDALFYDFLLESEGHHYLAELKHANKSTVLDLIQRQDKDGIYRKVKDSLDAIRNNLIFGGNQEGEELISHIHFFLVYGGLVDTASRDGLQKLKQKYEKKDANSRRASRRVKPAMSEKTECEICRRFEDKLENLGLKPCSEDIFPGAALPRWRKEPSSSQKIRYFTLLSAADFGQMVERGYFSSWNWGDYIEQKKTEQVAEEKKSIDVEKPLDT